MTLKAALSCRTFLCFLFALGVWVEGKELTTITVSDGASLGAALKQEDVNTINVRGKIRLSKATWVPEGTVHIRNGRRVILQADDPGGAQAVLDMGTMVDAIHVGNGSHLELRRLRIPNCASRHVRKPSPRVRLRVAGIFALWPSITLAINSSMSFSDSVFYYWSDKEWDSCDKFRSAAMGVLNPKNLPGMLEWSGSDTTVFIKGSQNTSQALIDIVKNKTYVGAFKTNRTNHTLVCLPDPFTDEKGGLPIFTIIGILTTVAIAAGTAQYMGLIELRPAVVASVHGSSRGNAVPILGSNGQIVSYGSRGSLGSNGTHGSHPSAVDHLSGVLRERQKALLGGLELGELLGRGSFGKVYKGRWRGAMVAVKIVTHDRTLATLAETLRESALSTSIQHPNVVTTFKVRTIRSQGGSNDQASAALTWTTAEDGCLDAAAGGQEQLLARAMSIAGGVLSAGGTKPSKLSRTMSGNLEITPAIALPMPSSLGVGIVEKGAARSLPHQPHDSAASSPSLTPPRGGFLSQSLPFTTQSGTAAKDPVALGSSTSLLQQRSSRGSEADGGAEAPQLAAKAASAFAGAGQDRNAEPLSVALQMKAAAAIAAELPEAAEETAKTLEAKVQNISAATQRRSCDAAQDHPGTDGDDDRVPLELLSRPASRRSQGSIEQPAVPEQAAIAFKEPMQPAGVGSPPAPAYLSAADDEPEPLSMSMEGELANYQQPQEAPDQAGGRMGSDADEREPLSMSMKGGPFMGLQAAPAGKSWGADEPMPLSMNGRKPSASLLQSAAEDEDADAPEPLVSRKRRPPLANHSALASYAALGPRIHNESSDLAQMDMIMQLRACQSGNGAQGDAGAASPYLAAHDAGQGLQRPGSSPALPGPRPGPGPAQEPEGANTDDEPQPLSASMKSGSGTQAPSPRLGTPRPPDQSRPPGLPYRKSASIGIPGTLSAIASKMPSFGRKSPSLLPSTPEDGPGLLESSVSKPIVPPALLTGHSTGVSGSAAETDNASNGGPDLLETWLILEYCDQGSFDHAIRSGKFTKDLGAGVLCLMDIAAGMEHLHSLGVLHADLKGANVLLKSSAVSNYDKRGYTCKLADFGLSRVMEHNSTHISTSTFGTAAYMPAELLMEGKMTKAADVYSFAMLMHELLTGQQLFEGMRQSQIICKVITGWRPSIPKGSPKAFVELMSECWHNSFDQRPHFPEILLRLRGIYKDLRMAAG